MFSTRTLTTLAAGAAMVAFPAIASAQVAVGRTPMPATDAQTTPPAAQAPTAPASTPQTPAAQAPAAQQPGQAAPGTAAAAPAATTTIAAALPTIPGHATLLRLVQAAKLDAQLAGPGPFTLFAPNDAAFARLPAGTLDTLLAPANVASLTTILKNHLVAGSMDEKQIRAAITAGGGRATLNTLSGQPLIASIDQGSVLLTDAVGNKSYIDKADIREANGVIHSTNGISLPKLG